MPRAPSYSKPALTYAEQIKHLKESRLHIPFEAKAAHLLQNISFYRFPGYGFPLLKKPIIYLIKGLLLTASLR